ncbi:hypothetical protein [Fibrobacter sp.]|uniref:hypothetical protein n=1 Tax=Fibrobacter sp. TaxID=35828 RepID=UPI0025BD468C|nr:hypothetical protein [Fibrobacter sp.]MBR3071071.1 hypothetical protein [Fibrobacter sp.]
MNIEKKIVSQSTQLSSIAKKTIAATLGISAVYSFNACSGGDMSTEPIESQEPPKAPSPESSYSNEFSSSSKYLDIPQSHEAISSEVLKALSSAAVSANSTATDAVSSVAQPASSSANAPSSASQTHYAATQNSSSSAATPASAADSSASTLATPASSATAPSNLSSSSFKFGDTLPGYQECPPPYPSTDPCKCVPDGTTVKYQTEFGVQVIMCPQSSSSYSGDGLIFSMVTTFELDDIIV